MTYSFSYTTPIQFFLFFLEACKAKVTQKIADYIYQTSKEAKQKLAT